MHKSTKAVPLGLAAAALLAPSAQAAVQVVPNPAPGVTSLSVNDEAEAGKVVIRATTPVSDGHFSAMFLDLDGNGAADRAVLATKGSDGSSVALRSTPNSTSACQQFEGTTASPVPGTVVAMDANGWTVKVPKASLPGAFGWKVTATAPGEDDLCGGTDGGVLGLVTSLAGAREFTTTPAAPADTTAPGAPQGLAATAGNGSVALDWADNGESDLAGYLVYGRAVGGTFTLVGEPTASALKVSGLANGTTYEYYVRAKDATGNLSAESGRVTATPSAPAPVQPPVTTPTTDDPPPFSLPSGYAVKSLKIDFIEFYMPPALIFPIELVQPINLGVVYNELTVPVHLKLKSIVNGGTGAKGASIAKKRKAAKRVKVAGRKLTLAPGEGREVEVKLNRAGRKLLKKRGVLKLVTTITATPAGGAPASDQLVTKVKLAKKKAGR